MRGFYIYETVVIPIKLSNPEALNGYKKIIISISQGSQRQVDKIHLVNDAETDITVDSETGCINVFLNQDETKKFTKGSAIVQVNIYYETQERNVSSQTTIEVYDNLFKRVIAD